MKISHWIWLLLFISVASRADIDPKEKAEFLKTPVFQNNQNREVQKRTGAKLPAVSEAQPLSRPRTVQSAGFQGDAFNTPETVVASEPATTNWWYVGGIFLLLVAGLGMLVRRLR